MVETSSIKVVFCLTANQFDISDVTQRLGIEPTDTRTKEEFPPTSGEFACTEWSLERKEEHCRAVSIVFDRVLALLDGKQSVLQELRSEYGLKATFVVVIHTDHGDNPEMVLTPEIVTFAGALQAEIGFDLYCYEYDEE